MPWGEVCALIEPAYSNPEGSGRRPAGLERMLRICFLQLWSTFTMAVKRRGAPALLHPDRGSRFSVGDYRAQLVPSGLLSRVILGYGGRNPRSQ